MQACITLLLIQFKLVIIHGLGYYIVNLTSNTWDMIKSISMGYLQAKMDQFVCHNGFFCTMYILFNILIRIHHSFQKFIFYWINIINLNKVIYIFNNIH